MTPSSRRHVALLGPANSVHLQRWALGLAEAGWRVSVISQHRHGALPLPDGIDCHWLPWRGAAGYFLNRTAVRRLLARLQPDLLHVHYASGYGTTGAKAGHHPMLLSVWGSDVYEFPHRSAWHAGRLRKNLAAADALASTSHAMALALAPWLPPGTAPTVAITPFGVDTTLFVPAARQLAQRHGSVSQPLVVGAVRGLAPVYGLDLLIQAFARLRHHPGCPALRLELVGQGPAHAALQAQARALGVADIVSFKGAVPHAQVPACLQGFDIFVAPSRRESFGVAAVEAMACGLPVLVSDAGGLPEVVVHAESGWVVPRDNSQALGDALLALVQDPALRTRLGQAARQRAVVHYDWAACVQRMGALYETLCTPLGHSPSNRRPAQL
jgi:L-malate glycosyltransferase